jgi:uroporphyrinogen-III synthase
MLTHALPGVAVVLHSAAAAAHLAGEMDRLELPREKLHLIALGPRIAQAAGTGWAAIHTAPRRTNAACWRLRASVPHSRAACGGMKV